MNYKFHVIGVRNHETRYFNQLRNLLGFIATKPKQYRNSEIIIFRHGKEYFRCNYNFAYITNKKRPKEKQLRKFMISYFGFDGVKKIGIDR